MSDDEEVLLKSSDLYKYLSKNCEEEFETFDSNTGNEISPCIAEHATLENQTSVFNVIEDDTLSVRHVSKHDYKLVCVLLQSKLLFLEDLEVIESLFSQCIVKETHKLWSFSTLAMASSSLLSVALLTLKAPTAVSLSFASFSAGLLMWKSFNTMLEFHYVKQLSSYIKILQSLCFNIHSLLRFLKETEILSTGQVSTDNIGSAMYLPLNDVDFNLIPSWRLLPHLRQCLYDSISETIEILSNACNDIKDYSPSWIHITGFSIKTRLSTDDKVPETNKIFSETCHSIKKLQTLCENYLNVQSEFLRWIAFNLCPYVWSNSPNSFKMSKVNIFKVLKNTSTKLSAISSKLKLQFDMFEIFANHKPNPRKSLLFSFKENKSIDLQNIQADLHEIFLSALFMLQKTKNLEEKLDKTSNLMLVGSGELDLNVIESNLIDELSSVRSDLLKITHTYEEMQSRFISKNKITQKGIKDERTEENNSYLEELDGNNVGEIQSIGKVQSELKYGINSPDEVFLAISGSKVENTGRNYEDLWMERKPQVPKSLLSELSTTLIPIKKDFQEREKLALERSGLQDINDELVNKSDPKTSTQKSRMRKSNKYCYKRISSETSLSSTDDSSDSEMSSLPVESSEETMNQDSKSHNRPNPITVSSLANALNTATHNFVKLEEEFYSEDEENT